MDLSARLLVSMLVAGCMAPVGEAPLGDKAIEDADAFTYANFISDEFYREWELWTPNRQERVEKLQRFLTDLPYGFNRRSFLADFQMTDESGAQKSAAELIVDSAERFQINPIVILARMQSEQSLIAKAEEPPARSASVINPRTNQPLTPMDKAFGCGCRDNEPCDADRIGFDNQLACALEKLDLHYYLSELGVSAHFNRGQTSSVLDDDPHNPGQKASVAPTSHASAALYTYTPWIGIASCSGAGLTHKVTLLYFRRFQELGLIPASARMVGDAEPSHYTPPTDEGAELIGMVGIRGADGSVQPVANATVTVRPSSRTDDGMARTFVTAADGTWGAGTRLPPNNYAVEVSYPLPCNPSAMVTTRRQCGLTRYDSSCSTISEIQPYGGLRGSVYTGSASNPVTPASAVSVEVTRLSVTPGCAEPSPEHAVVEVGGARTWFDTGLSLTPGVYRVTATYQDPNDAAMQVVNTRECEVKAGSTDYCSVELNVSTTEPEPQAATIIAGVYVTGDEGNQYLTGIVEVIGVDNACTDVAQGNYGRWTAEAGRTYQVRGVAPGYAEVTRDCAVPATGGTTWCSVQLTTTSTTATPAECSATPTEPQTPVIGPNHTACYP